MGANECKSELEWLERKMEGDERAVREEPGEGEGGGGGNVSHGCEIITTVLKAAADW